jgi:hypothetical protein
MPRRKPKTPNLSKEQELSLKNKLDGIVLAEEMLSGLSTPDIAPIKNIRIMNVDNVKTEVETEARSILESLARFYNGTEDLPEDNYIRFRQKIDALSISTMAFQIRTAQHAISKLIEEIDTGRIEPRLFEVLAQLQNQIMQMPKNFSQYMSQMEKNYKQLKSEGEELKKGNPLEFDENGQLKNTPENQEALKVRGTKSLMEGLQSLMKNGPMVRDAEIVKENPEDDLINPRLKDSEGLGDNYGEESEDVTLEMDDDLFN